MYTEREAAVLAAVDEGALVRTLEELIAVPSVSGSAAEAEIQQVLARKLGELGAEVDLWSMDLGELCADPGFPGMEVEREEAWGVVGYYGGYG
ncbi:MAG TPA: peptidase M20, partial [Streptomyces sp.]